MLPLIAVSMSAERSPTSSRSRAGASSRSSCLRRRAGRSLPIQRNVANARRILFRQHLGVALRLAAPRPDGGNGSGLAFFNQLAGNGVFLTFIALSTLLVLVLPVVVAVVAGDSVAGEAGYGTLRYLLAVPAGRTRLLAVKYGVIVTFALCATFIVSAVALALGVAQVAQGEFPLSEEGS